MGIEKNYMKFSHIVDAEGRRLCDLQGEDDATLSGSNCIACWRCAALRFVEMEEEVARLLRENDQLIEAARLGATVVHGDCTIPAGCQVGFLFVLGGAVKVEACERLMFGLDSQIGTPVETDTVQIVKAVQS